MGGRNMVIARASGFVQLRAGCELQEYGICYPAARHECLLNE